MALVDTESTDEFIQPWIAKQNRVECYYSSLNGVGITYGSRILSENNCLDFKFMIRGI